MLALLLGLVTNQVIAQPTVSGWGHNEFYQLGNNLYTNYNNPITVSGLTDVIRIEAGYQHGLAMKTDGTLWAWGRNNAGQLGDGTNNASFMPRRVGNLTDMTAIGGKDVHALAVKSDGTVYAWGLNDTGQLGDETQTNSNIPLQVAGIGDAVAVNGASYHTMVLKKDGTVWTWGSNAFGQLGTGQDNRTPLLALTGAKAIAGTHLYSLAIKSDGTVWAWGWNDYGQLGNGGFTGSKFPLQVSGLSGVVAIATGNYHSLALKDDGTVWTWGRNNNGQLGNGSNADSTVPVRVSGLTDVVAISASGYHSLALKRDGTVRGWGLNDHGQLGNCSFSDSTTPVAARGLNGVSAIAAGSRFSYAIGNPPSTTPCGTDGTPPQITPTITGTLGANGWYTSNTTVTWTITDPESGVATTTGCDPVTLIANTSGTLLTCSATNGDSLSNSASVTLKIDKTPPTVIPSLPLPPPNGIYTSDVPLNWSVSDPDSGIATSPNCGSVTLTATTIVTCTATNGAGLATTVAVNVKIDKTKFVNITLATVPSGLQVTLGGQSFPSPHTYKVLVGSQPVISTGSPQNGAVGVRYDCLNWSDAGAISHSILAPDFDTVITATFKTIYQLTKTQISPYDNVNITLFLYEAGSTAPVAVAPFSASGADRASWVGSAPWLRPPAPPPRLL